MAGLEPPTFGSGNQRASIAPHPLVEKNADFSGYKKALSWYKGAFLAEWLRRWI